MWAFVWVYVCVCVRFFWLNCVQVERQNFALKPIVALSHWLKYLLYVMYSDKSPVNELGWSGSIKEDASINYCVNIHFLWCWRRHNTVYWSYSIWGLMVTSRQESVYSNSGNTGMEIRTSHWLSRSSSPGYIPSNVTTFLTHLGSVMSEGTSWDITVWSSQWIFWEII